MEDLDSLLQDLGKGKSGGGAGARPKQNRPLSSRVDLNELEDLMEDLAAPTAKQMPTVTKVQISSSSASGAAAAPAAPQTTSIDDLDALMESLNAASSKRVSAVPRPAAAKPAAPSQPKPAAAPAAAAAAVETKPSYQPPPPAQAPAPAPIKGDDLDKLLSNLTMQMNNIDSSNPASRGVCATCNQGILGEVIQAMGRSYHPEHFTCASCKDALGTRSFYEQNGQIWCEPCFQDKVCPKCAQCSKPITDRCVTALGKKWHVEHFICTTCLKPFPNGQFFERDGRPYCEADFYGAFAPKCARCSEPIKGDCINALGQQWHPEHFSCEFCQQAFTGTFFERDGRPYCETHYHQAAGSLCAGCNKPITGRCVNAVNKKWHPEHFVCAFCMNPLAGTAFSERNNKAYCKDCHGKLFQS